MEREWNIAKQGVEASTWRVGSGIFMLFFFLGIGDSKEQREGEAQVSKWRYDSLSLYKKDYWKVMGKSEWRKTIRPVWLTENTDDNA